MVNYKLSYFDIRGLGETARLIMHYAKVPFEDERLGQPHWQGDYANHKEKFPHGKVPVLEIDGKQFVESNAINRYLARKNGLAGKDEIEELVVDAIGDYHKDVYADLAPYIYVKLGFREGNLDAQRKDFHDATNKHFANYVKMLKESGSGFFVKSGLTWVDFMVSEYLSSIKIHAPETFEQYPELAKFIDRVRSLPEIKDYVEKRKVTDF